MAILTELREWKARRNLQLQDDVWSELPVFSKSQHGINRYKLQDRVELRRQREGHRPISPRWGRIESVLVDLKAQGKADAHQGIDPDLGQVTWWGRKPGQ